MSNDETNLPAVEAPQELTPQGVKDRLDKVAELMRLAMNKDQDYGVIPGTKKPTLLKPGAEKLLLMMRLDPQYDAKVERWDGMVAVISTCTLFHIATGNRMGSGMGACDSTERGRERAPFNTILKIANKRALVAAVLNVTGASQIFTQDMEDGGDEAAVGDGGRRKASSGRGAQSPPPARPGPDDLSTPQARNLFWNTVLSRLPEDEARKWVNVQYKAVGVKDLNKMTVGQLAALNQKLSELGQPEPAEAEMSDADAKAEHERQKALDAESLEEPDLDF